LLKKIISGCQTGADIAGVDAAIANDFPYGGWVPKGRRTSDGPLPGRYVVQEMPTTGYPKRTEQNVIDSDGTVIFTHGKLSGGSGLTRKFAMKHGRPCLHLDMSVISIEDAVNQLAQWVRAFNIETLNVAGRSASKDERIYDATFSVIDSLLKQQN
jgi:hypothetical protein